MLFHMVGELTTNATKALIFLHLKSRERRALQLQMLTSSSWPSSSVVGSSWRGWRRCWNIFSRSSEACGMSLMRFISSYNTSMQQQCKHRHGTHLSTFIELYMLCVYCREGKMDVSISNCLLYICHNNDVSHDEAAQRPHNRPPSQLQQNCIIWPIGNVWLNPCNMN